MTIKFLDVKSATACQFVEDLYITAFPTDERRPIYKMYSLYNEEDSPYNIELIEEGEHTVGFITYWDFEKFIFIEHFSISGKHRNGGFGKKALTEFMKKINHREVVFEVETEVNEMAKRRIGFYQRLGFKLWPQHPYTQPSYTEHGSPIAMHLMTSANFDLTKHVDHVVDTLYKTVYRVGE